MAQLTQTLLDLLAPQEGRFTMYTPGQRLREKLLGKNKPGFGGMQDVAGDALEFALDPFFLTGMLGGAAVKMGGKLLNRRLGQGARTGAFMARELVDPVTSPGIVGNAWELAPVDAAVMRQAAQQGAGSGLGTSLGAREAVAMGDREAAHTMSLAQKVRERLFGKSASGGLPVDRSYPGPAPIERSMPTSAHQVSPGLLGRSISNQNQFGGMDVGPGRVLTTKPPSGPTIDPFADYTKPETGPTRHLIRMLQGMGMIDAHPSLTGAARQQAATQGGVPEYISTARRLLDLQAPEGQAILRDMQQAADKEMRGQVESGFATVANTLDATGQPQYIKTPTKNAKHDFDTLRGSSKKAWRYNTLATKLERGDPTEIAKELELMRDRPYFDELQERASAIAELQAEYDDLQKQIAYGGRGLEANQKKLAQVKAKMDEHRGKSLYIEGKMAKGIEPISRSELMSLLRAELPASELGMPYSKIGKGAGVGEQHKILNSPAQKNALQKLRQAESELQKTLADKPAKGDLKKWRRTVSSKRKKVRYWKKSVDEARAVIQKGQEGVLRERGARSVAPDFAEINQIRAGRTTPDMATWRYLDEGAKQAYVDTVVKADSRNLAGRLSPDMPQSQADEIMSIVQGDVPPPAPDSPEGRINFDKWKLSPEDDKAEIAAERLGWSFGSAKARARELGIPKRVPRRGRSASAPPAGFTVQSKVVREAPVDDVYLRSRFWFLRNANQKERTAVVAMIQKRSPEAAAKVKGFLADVGQKSTRASGKTSIVDSLTTNLRGLNLRDKDGDLLQPNKVMEVAAILRHRETLAKALRRTVEQSTGKRVDENARRAAMQQKIFQELLQNYGYQGMRNGDLIFLPMGQTLHGPNVGDWENKAFRLGRMLQAGAIPMGAVSQGTREQRS